MAHPATVLPAPARAATRVLDLTDTSQALRKAGHVSALRARLVRPVSLLGTGVDVVGREDLWHLLEQAVARRERLALVSVNVHWLQLCRADPQVAELAESFDLRLVDGTPVRWLAEAEVGRTVDKLSGSDLVMDLCARSAREGWRIFLLGAAPGVAARAAERAAELFPGCVVVGHAAPERSEVEDVDASRRLCDQVNRTDADVVVVGLGQPLQERWLERHGRHLTAPILLGAGCSIDLLAGRVRRAPVWAQRHGLEWLWRLWREPGRLWRRYLVEDLPVGLAMGVRRATRRRAGAHPGHVRTVDA